MPLSPERITVAPRPPSASCSDTDSTATSFARPVSGGVALVACRVAVLGVDGPLELVRRFIWLILSARRAEARAYGDADSSTPSALNARGATRQLAA
jgi:hypothetical protein